MCACGIDGIPVCQQFLHPLPQRIPSQPEAAKAGHRPARSIRGIRSANGTSSQTTIPAACISSRLSPSQGVPPPVDDHAGRSFEQFLQHIVLHAAEGLLTFALEER